MWRRVARRSRRPHLGLALSGGAARGIAHVGVLKVFEEHGVAVDCVAGTSAGALGGGDIAFAIRASCALPGWYVPVVDEQGRQLVDGGLVANLPTSVARALGAEVVVAVDVNYEGAKFIGTPTSVVGVLLQSIVVVQ